MAQMAQPVKAATMVPTVIHASAVGSWVSRNMMKEMAQAAGIVTTHARTISPTTFQLAPLPEATPAPTTELAAAWVVEIGTPSMSLRRWRWWSRCWRRTGVGVQGGDLQAHGLDDLPAPHKGADGDRRIGSQRDPLGDLDALAVGPDRRVPGAEEQRCDDAHRLLRIVGAVSERQSSGRQQLQPLEDRVVVVPLQQPLDPEDQVERDEGDRDGDSWGCHDADGRLAHAVPGDRGEATAASPAPTRPPMMAWLDEEGIPRCQVM